MKACTSMCNHVETKQILTCLITHETSSSTLNPDPNESPILGSEKEHSLTEREDKKKHGGDETNQTQEGGTHTKTKHGSGFEGLTNQTRTQPQRQKTRNNQPMTKPKPQQKKKQKSHQRLQGSVHCRVEGPMGRPAFS